MRTLIILSCALTMSASAQLNVGLVGHWPVNNNLADVSGNGLDGIQVTPFSATIDRGGSAGCAIISEEGGFYTNTTPLLDLDPAGALSMSFWLRKEGTGNEGAFMRLINGPVSCDFTLSNSLARFGTQAQPNLLAPPATTFSMDQNWHHFVCVYDDRDWYLFTDGVLLAQNTTTTEEVFPGPASFHPACIWGMAMDDLRVYDRALLPAEVQQLFELEPNCEAATGIADHIAQAPVVTSNGNGTFAVQLRETPKAGARLRITDARGALVREHVLNTTNALIDLQDEAPGLYCISILDNASPRTVRVVRE